MIALQETLADASWLAVRNQVQEAGGRLRAGGCSDQEVAEIATLFSVLSRHPKFEVRKAVAHSVQYLPDSTVPAPLAHLLQDENEWVREAARQTLSRRTEMTHTDVLKEQHEDTMVGWLSDLERKHGPRARNAALRVGRKYTNLLIHEAYHELVKVTTPLGAVLLNLKNELEAKEIDRASCKRRLERAQGRLTLLDAIIESLQDFTLDVTPEFRSEGLRAMVAQAVKDVRDHLRPDQPRVVISNSVSQTIQIEAHRPRVVQALKNLLHNAYESYDGIRGRRRIWIDAVEEPSRVMITVRDAGCGISEENLSDCIKLFVTTKVHGTGFGLPFAKKVIESEQFGRLVLSSAVGEGTTVTITLPKDQEKPGGEP